MSAVLTIDKSKVKQSFASAANSYDELATLQRKVGLELIIQFSEYAPHYLIVDVGCGTGFITQQLVECHSVQHIIALDIAFSMVDKTREKTSELDAVQYICADAEFIPLVNDSINTIISNLALQWCQNLSQVFKGFSQALKPQGQLLFSTFGPNTLHELKQAWAKVDDYMHVNNFYSVEDIIVFLDESGFIDIKIESRSYQSEYATVLELMRELKGIGAHNVLSNRNRQMTSKAAMQAMITEYEKKQVLGKIPATYEILYVSAKVT